MNAFKSVGAVTYLLLSLPLLAQQIATAPTQAEEAKLPIEVIDPSPHLPGMPGWIVLFTIVIIVAPLAILAVFLLQKSDAFSSSKPAANPLADAKEKLLALRDFPAETTLAEISTRISLIVRQYLARSKSDSALFQTREEFLTDEQRLQHVPEPAKSETADFLSELASLQYAPPSHDPEQTKDLIDQGFQILDRVAEPEPEPNPAATDD